MRSSVSTADLDGLRAAIGSGVVLPYALALAPAPLLTAGALMWPWENAHRVLHRWRTWTRTVAEDITSVARLVRAPHLAGVAPCAARARVRGRRGGDRRRARDRPARELRRLEPEIDTVALVSAKELLARQLPAEGTRTIGEHMLLRELCRRPRSTPSSPPPGPGSGSELVAAELRHLGGEEFAVVGLGVAADAEQAERVRIGLGQLARRLAPWAHARAA